MHLKTLTFCISCAADNICEFGFQTGVCDICLSFTFVSTSTQRYQTLQWNIWPKTLALMNCQCRRIIQKQTSIL